MYSMNDFILQGLPPTHTNWGEGGDQMEKAKYLLKAEFLSLAYP